MSTQEIQPNDIGSQSSEDAGQAVAVVDIEGLDLRRISPLLPLLESIESMHGHKFDKFGTVADVLADANRAALAGEEPTDEQAQAVIDQSAVDEFVISTRYKEVYTPRELAKLADTFTLLRQRNRAGFNGIESTLIDVVLSRGGEPGALTAALPISISSLKGIRQREDDDAPNRRGMQWTTFTSLAAVGSAILKSRVRPETNANAYFMKVSDPDYPLKNELNLGPIYQFAADSFAFDTLGERSEQVDQLHKEAFVGNCEMVNNYWARLGHILSNLPQSIRGDRASASFELANMVESMNKRLQGNEIKGINKSYKYDPAGAIRLQLKIGHTVESIKRQIAAIQSGQAAEEEIIPLD